MSVKYIRPESKATGQTNCLLFVQYEQELLVVKAAGFFIMEIKVV